MSKWLKLDDYGNFKVVEIPEHLQNAEIEDVLGWLNALTLGRAGCFRYVSEERELQEYLRRLEKRVENLKEAVGRWRRKAKVDQPPEGPEFLKSEIRYLEKGKVEYFEHYLLPVERNERLIYEAHEWLKQNGWLGKAKRLYYQNGWIVMVQEKF